MNGFLSYRDSAKMAVRLFRICLYSVREHGKQPKIALFVQTLYGKVVGNQLETQHGGRVPPVHAYIVYVSMENTLITPFLCSVCMAKCSVIDRRPKMAVGFHFTCLYCVRERETRPNIASFVQTLYRKVAAN